MLAPFALLVTLMAAPAQAPPPAAAPPKPLDCSAPEHRQFDFWIGEWDVVPNPETRPASAPPPSPGRKPATNIIEKAHDGRVVVENWNDGQGGTTAWRFQGRRTVRLTFFPIGPATVRQFSESLNIDGTWSINYDLIDTRRTKPT